MRSIKGENTSKAGTAASCVFQIYCYLSLVTALIWYIFSHPEGRAATSKSAKSVDRAKDV
jgi:hypothetical protein